VLALASALAPPLAQAQTHAPVPALAFALVPAPALVRALVAALLPVLLPVLVRVPIVACQLSGHHCPREIVLTPASPRAAVSAQSPPAQRQTQERYDST
jgi:hypothetical protein